MDRSAISRAAGTLRRALSPGDSLLDRAVTGGVWMGLLGAFDRVVRTGTYVVLAGLLSPVDFGVLGIAALAITVLRRCSRLGLSEALIQRAESDVDPLLDTAWTLRIARGAAIAVAAYLAAPWLATTFDAPGLTPVVRVLALGPLVAGLRNPGVVYFEKELAFHRQFAYSSSRTVAFAAVAVSLALALGNVWALVLGTLAGTVARTVASYLMHAYRPRPRFEVDVARELLSFGKWIFGSGVVLLLLNRGDDAFVGWFLGASALGLYLMAFRFANAPATEVTHVVSRVVFPAFSRVQSDEARLRDGFFATTRLVAYLSFPMAVGIFVVAPVFVRAYLGPQWLPMVDAMRALAVWGLARAIVATVGPLFRAIGHPEYSTALQASRLVVVGILLYPATAAWGIAGTALAIVASAVLQNPVALAVALRTIDGSPIRFARTLAFPGIGSLVMGAAVWWLEGSLRLLPAWAEFVVLVCAGGVVYVAALLVGERSFDLGLGRDLGRLREAIQ